MTTAEPVFIEVDPQAIVSEMKAQYEDLTGRPLNPGQVENLLIQVFAYRETLLKTSVNEAAKLNLLEFTKAPMLDYLAQLLGVERLPASAAVCTLKLVFVTGHDDVVIPANTRIQSTDGKVVFGIDDDLIVPFGVDEIEATATCLTDGILGNGYTLGAISVILDPQPYLSTTENINITSGGADQESDDTLKERVRLAPASFSTAGPVDAYVFWAKSANPGIVDVSVLSLNPGDVNIFPLMADGELPNSNVLQQVYDVCNNEKRRPLTDNVIVEAPAVISYDIEVELTLLTGQVPADAINTITDLLTDYAKSRRNKCGLDIVRSKISRLCSLEGIVYDVNVVQPSSTVSVDKNEVGIYQSINVSVTGYSDE